MFEPNPEIEQTDIEAYRLLSAMVSRLPEDDDEFFFWWDFYLLLSAEFEKLAAGK